jgi:hypothetical protein
MEAPHIFSWGEKNCSYVFVLDLHRWPFFTDFLNAKMARKRVKKAEFPCFTQVTASFPCPKYSDVPLRECRVPQRQQHDLDFHGPRTFWQGRVLPVCPM